MENERERFSREFWKVEIDRKMIRKRFDRKKGERKEKIVFKIRMRWMKYLESGV